MVRLSALTPGWIGAPPAHGRRKSEPIVTFIPVPAESLTRSEHAKIHHRQRKIHIFTNPSDRKIQRSFEMRGATEACLHRSGEGKIISIALGAILGNYSNRDLEFDCMGMRCAFPAARG